MSCLVHSNEEMNEITKFLVLEVDMDSEKAIYLVSKMFVLENLAYAYRYKEQVDFSLVIYRDERFKDLRELNPIEALKRLDSITYECAESDYTSQEIMIIHKELTELIMDCFNIKESFRKSNLYEEAYGW